MVKFYTTIPSSIIPWIQEQKMFWVATAPLSPSGHVNLSPKGYEGTFHVVDQNRVWYEDLTGSGVETIAHLREPGNGRMTIVLVALKGAPRIVRLFGIGTVHEFGSPEYEALIPVEKRHVGSRSAIVLDIHKVSSSCGYAVPLYDFKSHRTALDNFSVKQEAEDIKAEAEFCAISTSPSTNTSTIDIQSKVQTYPLTAKGLKGYWRDKNSQSIDGLPGVHSGFKATQQFSPNSIKARDLVRKDDIESVEPASSVSSKVELFRLVPRLEQEKHGIILGFVLGALAVTIAQRGMSTLAGIQW